MHWLGIFLALLGGLGASSGLALTPLPDDSPAFFSGDWIGTGAQDLFCLIRLTPDGSGTVLVGGGSGDWRGASIRWRNRRQSVDLIEARPLPAEPRRRLLPLPELTLNSGFNRTLQLKLSGNIAACELQPHGDVQRRTGEAELLLNGPAKAGKPDGRK